MAGDQPLTMRGACSFPLGFEFSDGPIIKFWLGFCLGDACVGILEMVDPTLHGLYIPLFFGTVGFFKIRSWNMPNSGCSPWLICNARFRRLRFAHDHLRYKIRGSRTQNITIPSFYTARMST